MKKFPAHWGRAIILGCLVILLSYFSVTPLLWAQSGSTYLPMVVGDGAAQSPNEPPVAADDAYRTDMNVPLVVGSAVGVLSNDGGPEGTPLTAALEDGPARGALTLNHDGSFSYTPETNFVGSDGFTYRATDGLLVSPPATVTLSVRASNNPPVAADDLYQSAENTALEVSMVEGLLANDTDPEADPLHVVLVSGPVHGALTLNPGGSFEYRPAPGFDGLDSFTYRATDGALESDTATVTLALSGLNDPPRFVSGTIAFEKRVIDDQVKQIHSVLAADLDGDGDIDAAATDYVDGVIPWYENDGAGNFTVRLLEDSLAGAYPSHVDDVDGDGDADVLAGGYLADTYTWYRQEGGGAFTRFAIDNAADGAHSIITIDLDGDGDADLLTADQDAGAINWYENDSMENFSRRLIDNTATGAKRAAAADLDGDGDNDILAASKLDNTIAWFRNDGGGMFIQQFIDLEAEGARTVIPVDVDGDGDPDALAASRADDTIAWYENDGVGNFTRRPIDEGADGAYGVFAVDVDFDNDVDIFSAVRNVHTVALYTQVRAHAAQATAGGSLVLDGTLLAAEDPDDSPAGLVYTLTTVPVYGELRIDGTVIGVGGMFTQADVDGNRVVYFHFGTSALPDGFAFTLSDGGEDGVGPTSGHVAIEVLSR